MSAVTQVTQASGGRGRVIELSRCSLIVRQGSNKGHEHVIDGDRYRIGSSGDNNLVLRDRGVSREHCEVVLDSSGYLLRDLGSTNGTKLNGSRVNEAYVSEGQIITIGQIELEVRPHSEKVDVEPSARDRFGEIVGADPAMREVFGLLERLSGTDATLLVEGETGSGKDVLARSVHGASTRKEGPFIVVDCGAVAGSLIESELFGHEKGAFTGAHEQRQGAFELAHGGTLFLDEIGELPLELQPTLLRVLESRRVRRVGGSKEITLDIRVIAASNRNLQKEVERGKFRQDLYYRLAVVPIHVPPLRERLGDIPLLARHLLDGICQQQAPGKPSLSLDQQAVDALCAHDWPGNIRELRNVLERSALLTRASGATSVRLGLFAAPVARAPGAGAEPTFDPALKYGETRALWEAQFELRYVTWLLERHEGNLSAAAREAGMDRKYLHKLARKHGIRD